MSRRDDLEKQGQAVRKRNLITGIIVTIIATVTALFIVKSIADYPIFYLSAAALVAVAVGYYSLTNIEPGHIGQPNSWGKLGDEYRGHGVNWSLKAAGIKLDPIDVREQITEIPFIVVSDKEGTRTKFTNTKVRWEIESPLAFRLHLSPKIVDVMIKSSSTEAIREFAKERTYEKCRQLVSELENGLKENIENKLREEEYTGINIVSVDIEDVEASEIVEKEDQEIKARDKRMKQTIGHAAKIEKKFKVSGKEALEQFKIISKISEEKITREIKEGKTEEKKTQEFELGPNTARVVEGLGKEVLELLAKPKRKTRRIKND